MNEHASWLAMYESLTTEERAEYWREEHRREQRALIDGLVEHIEIDEWFIQYAQDYARDAKQQFISGRIDEATVRERLVLAASVIQGSQDSIKILRRDIAHYTKYPLGSAKRRAYIKQLARRG